MAAPGYLQRLESERRVKFEMDLLSRMQLALLPQAPPDVQYSTDRISGPASVFDQAQPCKLFHLPADAFRREAPPMAPRSFYSPSPANTREE